jgi:hypothetical protein
MARQIVAYGLGLPVANVAHHDNGSLPGMVDAIITYADGRTAALEVVTDTDPGYTRISAAIRKAGGQLFDAPELEYTWQLTLSDDAKVFDIRKHIVFVLSQMEHAPQMAELEWPDGWRWRSPTNFGDVLTQLGVARAMPMPTHGEVAKVILHTRTLWGCEGEPDGVPTWAADFLVNTAHDVPEKLAASGHDERHAFLWAMVTTDYSVCSVLDGTALPNLPPQLPAEVTHLWVGAFYGGSRTLRWQPGEGWSEVYRIPKDGRPVDLPPL